MYYLVRPGEARGLQWGDFDWANGLVHIQRDIDYKAGNRAGELKTKSSNRLVPIPLALRDILDPIRGMPNMYLFTGMHSKEPLSKTTAERIWIDLMEAAGLTHPTDPEQNAYRAGDIRARLVPDITPHVLRHDYITMCWENGIDVYTTMRLAGHTSIKTTLDIYTHLTDSQLENAKSQVDKMFSPKAPKTRVAQKLHNQ